MWNAVFDRFISTIIRRGNLRITYPNGKTKLFGGGIGKPVHLRFNSRKAVRLVLMNPEFYLGHCYAEGMFDLVEGDMYDLLEAVFTGNPGGEFEYKPWMKALAAIRYKLRNFRENNVTS